MKSSVLAEIWAFMKVRKKWWLLPVITILLLFGVLMTAAQGSVVAPFIYAIF